MIQKISFKNIHIFILSFILLSQLSNSYTCKKYVYDHNLLVLDWVPEFCYHHQNCKPNWKQITPQNQWIIKGFWPASKDLDFLNCIQYAGHDPNCYVVYSYNDNKLNLALQNQLNSFWPQITTSNDQKSDQWNQHGTCYLSVLQTLNPSMIGNEAMIFDSYYRDTIVKAKTLKLKLDANKTQFKTKSQLATNLGVNQNSFYALCQYDADYLSEIRICYDVKSSVGQQSITSCKVQQPNQCEFPAKIRKTSSDFYLKSILAFLMLTIMFIY